MEEVLAPKGNDAAKNQVRRERPGQLVSRIGQYCCALTCVWSCASIGMEV